MPRAAAGNVYVFNVFSQQLNVSSNGMPIPGGAIPGWANSGAAKYQPSSQAVPRKLNPSDGAGHFFNGLNQLALAWIDGLYTARVQIDGNALPLNQDLLLFVERTNWQMINQYGAMVASGPVARSGFDA